MTRSYSQISRDVNIFLLRDVHLDVLVPELDHLPLLAGLLEQAPVALEPVPGAAQVLQADPLALVRVRFGSGGGIEIRLRIRRRRPLAGRH